MGRICIVRTLYDGMGAWIHCALGAASMSIPKKQRTCRVCRSVFQPIRCLQNVCGPDCAIKQSQAKRAKDERVAQMADRKTTKIKLDAIKPRGKIVAEADRAFCSYIRFRDQLAGHHCVSSGKPLDWSGNNVDAGHYRSRGSAPHLRYDERNCHAQSKHDNRYLSGNSVDYRIGLIARIGLAEVEALESDNEPKKYSIQELKAIKSHYVAKLKQLRGLQAK